MSEKLTAEELAKLQHIATRGHSMQIPQAGDMLRLLAHIAALQAENEALRADKERLDWLEDRLTKNLDERGENHEKLNAYRGPCIAVWPHEPQDNLRFAIDVAIVSRP